MYFIVFFNFTPIAVAILLFVFILAGQLAAALPVIEVIFWILFGILSMGMFIMGFAVGAQGALKKTLISTVTIISFAFCGILSQSFFVSLESAYGIGRLEGVIEFIFTFIFGGMEWLFAFYGLAYASFNLIDAEDRTYWRRLLISIALIFIVWFVFF